MTNALNFLKSSINKPIKNSYSPVGNWLQGIVKEVEKGRLVVDFKVREEMTNPAGMLHGGMISLIADEMIGATIATLNLENNYVSINLTVDFLFGIRKGETLRTKTEIIRKGKNIINTECCFYNVNGKLLAKASSNSIFSKMKIKAGMNKTGAC